MKQFIYTNRLTNHSLTLVLCPGLSKCLMFSSHLFELKWGGLQHSGFRASVGSSPLLLAVPFQAFSFSLVRGTWALPNPEEKK